jgi:D-alanyl-D-alanine carboxypeptidase
LGDGKSTVEAHSSRLGVIVGSSDTSRGWDIGIRLPNASQWAALVAEHSRPSSWRFRESSSPLADPRVPVIAAALKREGSKVAANTKKYTPTLASVVAKYPDDNGIVVDGVVGPETISALKIDWGAKPAPTGTYNERYKVFFDSLVKGGFYSFDPDDLKVRRSIRTNNPGALNFSTWQQSRPGFVGLTPPDNSPQKNRTTIYRTPEHGVASWYVLLADRYGFSHAGSFTIETLARKYAGAGASPAAVQTYVRGWARASKGALQKSTVIRLAKPDEMLTPCTNMR